MNKAARTALAAVFAVAMGGVAWSLRDEPGETTQEKTRAGPRKGGAEPSFLEEIAEYGRRLAGGPGRDRQDSPKRRGADGKALPQKRARISGPPRGEKAAPARPHAPFAPSASSPSPSGHAEQGRPPPALSPRARALHEYRENMRRRMIEAIRERARDPYEYHEERNGEGQVIYAEIRRDGKLQDHFDGRPAMRMYDENGTLVYAARYEAGELVEELGEQERRALQDARRAPAGPRGP